MTMRKKNVGFTLIEIMLVLVLLSLSAVAVILNLPNTKQDEVKEQAERFFYRIQLLNEDAILNGQDFGVRVDEQKNTLTYMVLKNDGWSVLESKNYQEMVMPDEVRLNLEIGDGVWSKGDDKLFSQEGLFDDEMFAEYEEKKKEKPPQLFVLSSGEMTPFTLDVFVRRDRDNGWAVRVKESGTVSLMTRRELELEGDN